jgi:hypothetical protein
LRVPAVGMIGMVITAGIRTCTDGHCRAPKSLLGSK